MMTTIDQLNKIHKKWIKTQAKEHEEPIADIVPVVLSFTRKAIKQRLKAKGFSTDLFAYDLPSLIKAVELVTITDPRSVTTEDLEQIGVFESWEVWFPKSIRGSIAFGEDNQSAWCTVRNQGNVFEQYTNDQNEFLFYLKNDKLPAPYNRAAFCVDEGNIHWNSSSTVWGDNKSIPDTQVEAYFSPKLLGFIKQFALKQKIHPIKKHYQKIGQNLLLFHWTIEEKQKRYKKDPNEAEYYIDTFIGRLIRNPLSTAVIEAILHRDPDFKQSIYQRTELTDKQFDMFFKTTDLLELKALASNKKLPQKWIRFLLDHKNKSVQRLALHQQNLSSSLKIGLIMESAFIAKYATKYVWDLTMEEFQALLDTKSIRVYRGIPKAIGMTSKLSPAQKNKIIETLFNVFPKDEKLLQAILNSNGHYQEFAFFDVVPEEIIVNRIKANIQHTNSYHKIECRILQFDQELPTNIKRLLYNIVENEEESIARRTALYYDLINHEIMNLTKARNIAEKNNVFFKNIFVHALFHLYEDKDNLKEMFEQWIPLSYYLEIATCNKTLRIELATLPHLPPIIQKIFIHDQVAHVRANLYYNREHLIPSVKKKLDLDTSRKVQVARKGCFSIFGKENYNEV